MEIQFNSAWSDTPTLVCPGCGGDYLHQGNVEVFQPSHEDAIHGLHTIVGSAITAIDGDLANNPSRRRDGLIIWFHCEMCDVHPGLSIVQHKGNTFIEWLEPLNRMRTDDDWVIPNLPTNE